MARKNLAILFFLHLKPVFPLLQISCTPKRPVNIGYLIDRSTFDENEYQRFIIYKNHSSILANNDSEFWSGLENAHKLFPTKNSNFRILILASNSADILRNGPQWTNEEFHLVAHRLQSLNVHIVVASERLLYPYWNNIVRKRLIFSPRELRYVHNLPYFEGVTSATHELICTMNARENLGLVGLNGRSPMNSGFSVVDTWYDTESVGEEIREEGADWSIESADWSIESADEEGYPKNVVGTAPNVESVPYEEGADEEGYPKNVVGTAPNVESVPYEEVRLPEEQVNDLEDINDFSRIEDINDFSRIEDINDFSRIEDINDFSRMRMKAIDNNDMVTTISPSSTETGCVGSMCEGTTTSLTMSSGSGMSDGRMLFALGGATVLLAGMILGFLSMAGPPPEIDFEEWN